MVGRHASAVYWDYTVRHNCDEEKSIIIRANDQRFRRADGLPEAAPENPEQWSGLTDLPASSDRRTARCGRREWPPAV